jgi:chromosome segregation ATPase
MALQDVIGKVDQFAALLEKYEPATTDRNELMTIRKGLLEELKEAPFENEAQKEEVWDRFRALAAIFREKMEQTNLELASFAEEANRRIAALQAAIEKRVLSQSPGKDDFIALRQETDSVFEFIKQNNWPTKETRTAAWEQFNTLREQLRNKENEFYEKMREERELKALQSASLASIVLEAVGACKIDCQTDQTVEQWESFLHKAKEQQFIVGEFERRTKEEALKVPLKTQTEILRDIRKVANDNRDLFTWEDRQKVYAAFDEMKAALDLAWDNHKQELQKKRDEREQKKVEWERKQRDFLSMMEGKLQKQLEYKDKLEKFGTGQQEFVVRIETRLSNQQEYLLKLHDDLEELQAQYNAAWSVNFKERMQERIAQKKDKILSVEQDIESSKQKLQEVEDNVKAFPGRLLDAEKTIEEIQEKIAEVKQKLKLDKGE